ncbi:hypothetical protein HDU92_000732 [Lobulomyces angularis]|nr:hypothetical protein HDU92_000732 [Lobulomyces angularis]
MNHLRSFYPMKKTFSNNFNNLSKGSNHRQCSTYKRFFSSSSNFNKDENIFFKTKQVNATKSISKEENEENIDKKARLLIKCVCNVCKNVITKSFSKLAYLKGVVIIECNGCKSKHLIADHLGWFDSQKKIGTIEDILKEKGEEVKTLKFTGSLDEAMEFINKEKKET